MFSFSFIVVGVFFIFRIFIKHYFIEKFIIVIVIVPEDYRSTYEEAEYIIDCSTDTDFTHTDIHVRRISLYKRIIEEAEYIIDCSTDTDFTYNTYIILTYV